MEEVKKLIEEFKLVCFMNEFSPFCLKMKEILDAYLVGVDSSSVNFVYMEKQGNGNEIEKAVLAMAKCKHLPVVYIAGKPYDLDTITKMNENTSLETLLGEAGAIPSANFGKLQEMKKAYPLLVIGNSFSAYCLKVKEIIEGLAVGDGNYNFVIEDREDGKVLTKAAMLETKCKDAPYVFICEKYITTKQFLDMSQKNELNDFLAEKGVV